MLCKMFYKGRCKFNWLISKMKLILCLAYPIKILWLPNIQPDLLDLITDDIPVTFRWLFVPHARPQSRHLADQSPFTWKHNVFVLSRKGDMASILQSIFISEDTWLLGNQPSEEVVWCFYWWWVSLLSCRTWVKMVLKAVVFADM